MCSLCSPATVGASVDLISLYQEPGDSPGFRSLISTFQAYPSARIGFGESVFLSVSLYFYSLTPATT